MPTRPTSLMCPILAMPTTTVQKMIGAIIILISLMKRVAQRLQRLRRFGEQEPDRHADDDAADDPEIERAMERALTHGRLPRLLLGKHCHRCVYPRFSREAMFALHGKVGRDQRECTSRAGDGHYPPVSRRRSVAVAPPLRPSHPLPCNRM